MIVDPKKLRKMCSARIPVPQKEIERKTGIPQPRLSVAFTVGAIGKRNLEKLCDAFGFRFEDVELK
jgi:hypothetical protein